MYCDNDPLSSDNTKKLRGMLAIGIFVFHFCITNRVAVEEATGLGIELGIGSMFVGMFFMLSGFGLMESYKNKKDYLKGFVGKKIERLFVPLWICGIIALIVYWATEIGIGISIDEQYLYDFISGGPRLLAVWFVTELAFFYLIFFLAFKYLRGRWAIVSVTIACSLLMALLSDMPDKWSISGMMFPLGLFVSQYKKNIESAKPYVVLIVAIISSICLAIVLKENSTTPGGHTILGNLMSLFAVIFMTSILFIRRSGLVNYMSMLVLCNIVFFCLAIELDLSLNGKIALLLITLYSIPAGIGFLSPITEFIGNISYEFYLIHQVIIIAVAHFYSDVTSLFLVAITATVISAYFANRASRLFTYDKKEALPKVD
jgi:peptidoglycan/LPS O-acetylase OafA/YrhL